MSVYSHLYMAQQDIMPSCTLSIMPKEIHPRLVDTDFQLLGRILSSLGKPMSINDNIAASSAQFFLRMSRLSYRVNAILAFCYSSLGRLYYSKQLAIIGNMIRVCHSDILWFLSESLFKLSLWRPSWGDEATIWAFYHHPSVGWFTQVETIL